MKLKEDLNLDVLLNYGFSKIVKSEIDDDDYCMHSYDYECIIDHSRRGQVYYLLVSEETRGMVIYASKPDGSGGPVFCPEVLFKMKDDGLFA